MTESVDIEATSQYMTVAEVASHYRVKERTVYRWIKDGELAHVRIGGTVRILRSSVDERDAEAS